VSHHATGGGFMVDWRDALGKRHRKLLATEEAARILDAQLRESVRAERTQLRNLTRGGSISPLAALDLYLAELAVGRDTKAKLAHKLRAALARLNQPTLATVTADLCATYLATRAQDLSPTSLARETGDLKRFFAWLADPRQSYLPANPLQEANSKEPPPPPRHVLTYEEEAKVLATLTPRVLLRVLLALDAGLARQEITALRKNHINLEERTLTSWRQKTRRERTIPLTRRLHAALREATATITPDTRLQQWGGKEVKKGTDFLKKLWPRVGFHFRFHDLRHTFATRAAEATSNPFVVAELLGHSQSHIIFYRGAAVPQVTRRYVHPSLEELRAAIHKMEDANPNCKGEQTHARKAL
jgi:integrase